MYRIDVFPLFKIVLLSTFIIAVVACAPQQTTRKLVDAQAVAAAFAALTAGDYHSAAARFGTLANTMADSVDVSLHRLNAASAQLWAGQKTELKQTLERVPANGVPEELHLWQQILKVGTSLSGHSPVAAVKQLAPMAGERLRPQIRRDLHYLRALLYGQTREPLNEARERAALMELLHTDTERTSNANALWAALNKVAPHSLSRLRADATLRLSGWVELALLVQSDIQNSANFDRALQRWQERYPDHPAGLQIVQEIRELGKSIAVRPRSIALLLPFSGRFAEAAAAIREGFLTAWYVDNQQLSRPTLRLYDANVANIDSVYGQATQEGADLIVGPLQKDAVDVLARRSSLPVTTLALNEVSRPADLIRFYQFALAPEDEARQVAERAWLHGYKRALCVTPEDTWGARLLVAFAEQWRALGGELLESQVYPRPNKDFAGPIKRALNIDGSESRAKTLHSILGQSVKSETRRRDDVDFVFVAGFPSEVRQLRPQLEFHRGVDLPVFATSHVFAGTADRIADQDMNGITFGDMPWIIEPDHPEFAIFREVAEQWPEQANQHSRLHALGIDAYRLIPQLARLRIQRYARFRGVSGELSIIRGGRIQRQLNWAKFVDGRPLPVNMPTDE